MNENKNFVLVDTKSIPGIFIKVLEAKKLLESGDIKNTIEAVNKVGISRSAYYKYKDSVFHFYESTRGKTVTIAFNLSDETGILSEVLNIFAKRGANILTINQTIPINGIANLTITIETGNMQGDIEVTFKEINDLKGVTSFKILARE